MRPERHVPNSIATMRAAAEPRPQQNDHTMPLLRRRRSITHAQKNHDAVRLIRPTKPHSHHLALAQLRDLVLAEAELGQHFLGLLAEFRRPRGHLAWRARQRHRLADELDVAVLVVRHVLGDAEMLDLGVVEHLVDRIDRAAGHAGLVQFLDPGVRRFLRGELADRLHSARRGSSSAPARWRNRDW